MELAHIFIGQAILLSTVLGVLWCADERWASAPIRWAVRARWCAVADERGGALLLLSSTLFIFFLAECFVSQAGLLRLKRVRRRVREARQLLFQNTLVLFILFISAYVLQSLSARAYGFLGLAMAFTLVEMMGTLAGLRLVVTWARLGILVAGSGVFVLTFVRGADQAMSDAQKWLRVLAMLLQRRRTA